MRAILEAMTAQATPKPESSDNTVAIVGLIVAGIVGVAGPLLAAFFAGRRQNEQLAAAEKRQKAELDAAADRQTEELEAERVRLETTLAADRRKTMIEVRRQLLDEGAVLLVRFHAAFSAFVRASDAATPMPELDEVTNELSGLRVRMNLWFEEGSEVLEAYQQAIDATTSRAIEVKRARQQHGDDPVIELTDQAIREADAEVDRARQRFMVAAREYLAAEAN